MWVFLVTYLKVKSAKEISFNVPGKHLVSACNCFLNRYSKAKRPCYEEKLVENEKIALIEHVPVFGSNVYVFVPKYTLLTREALQRALHYSSAERVSVMKWCLPSSSSHCRKSSSSAETRLKWRGHRTTTRIKVVKYFTGRFWAGIFIHMATFNGEGI